MWELCVGMLFFLKTLNQLTAREISREKNLLLVLIIVNSHVIHLFWLHGDFFKRRWGGGGISGFYVN